MTHSRFPTYHLPDWARRDKQGKKDDRVDIFKPLAMELDI